MMKKTKNTILQCAAKFSSELFSKIVEANLYVWDKETMPKKQQIIEVETIGFLECLYSHKDGKVQFFDENFDLYERSGTYGRFELAESFADKIVIEMEYCVIDAYYRRQMCSAAFLIIKETLKFIVDFVESESEEKSIKNDGEKVEIKANLDDLLFMFSAALRYGLGRRTYATGLISDVIKANLTLLNEKWTVNLLRDLNGYEKDRQSGYIKDDDCDYESWSNLKQKILTIYKERGYTFQI